ncbi:MULTISPECIES: hypothetical protein [unclassified Mycolicibacterium]|uniref:hypothetical protein n=1 Tax=unclassified Mycolicibacterium TaxID=2636767 RepID=UPI001F4C22B8|nr:hypothetical protein [Mycolicibacterium sp. YH-1]UNB56392.1 hypothetical protein L0M16_25085 [Mycolicibacterium sp. YH-1]
MREVVGREPDGEDPRSEAEVPDESEPLEVSAAATPWPVVSAKPSPTATAPTRSH